MRKHIIHLEGIDGAGKSALLTHLSETHGYPIYREPGGTPLGEYLRNNVLYSKSYSPVSKRMMFALARTALQDYLLTDQTHKVALVDRSLVSSLVYDLGVEMEDQINAYLTLEVNFPDHIIYVKASPEIALERLKARPGGTKDEEAFLEAYIDQEVMPSSSTILDMLKLWATRYEKAFALVSRHHLIQHKPLSVNNNGELSSAIYIASELIHQVITREDS